MNIDFSIEEAVKKRYSVRSYSDRQVEEKKKEDIKSFIDTLESPFGKTVQFHFLDSEDIENGEKLGTYGVIKGAKNYIGTTINLEPLSLESLGYQFEALVLYLAHMDIGTCWLGGTFKREAFSKAMNIGEDETFPIMTPYGYIADKKHIKERAMRKFVKADKRMDWNELFFKDNFQTSLPRDKAEELEFPLEMVRLGPSASNKQPWRLVVEGKDCHFYEHKEPGYSDRFDYDIQRIDMGIAAAHFDFAVKEKGLKGYFHTSSDPKLQVPENIEYVFSWIRE